MRNLKYIYLLSVALLMSVGLQAQGFGPQAGDKSVALKFGRAISFEDVKFTEVNSGMNPIYSNFGRGVSISEPTASSYSSSNNVTNIIGVEGKYFVTSEIAARISASGSFGGSPSQDYVLGVADPTGDNYPGTYFPGFNMFEGRSKSNFFLDLGADYYFSGSYDRVAPYVGVQFNSIYSQLEIFDGFRGLDSNQEVIGSFDTRRGEAYALGGSIVAGIDYYLSEGMFIGIEVKALSYMYSVKKVFHQTGMEAQAVDAHTTSFLAQPSLKLGFRF